MVSKYLKGNYKEDGDVLLSLTTEDRMTSSNGLKVHKGYLGYILGRTFSL